jgi:hypothetical protein
VWLRSSALAIGRNKAITAMRLLGFRNMVDLLPDFG